MPSRKAVLRAEAVLKSVAQKLNDREIGLSLPVLMGVIAMEQTLHVTMDMSQWSVCGAHTHTHTIYLLLSIYIYFLKTLTVM